MASTSASTSAPPTAGFDQVGIHPGLRRLAVELGVVDRCEVDLLAACQGADVIQLAVPILAMEKLLARLAQLDQALSCQMLPLSSSSADADEGQASTPQPSSCQLNGKWLSAANLLCAEQIFFAIAFVIALLAPLSRRAPALPPPINISPPERRLHLTLCVWRE